MPLYCASQVYCKDFHCGRKYLNMQILSSPWAANNTVQGISLAEPRLQARAIWTNSSPAILSFNDMITFASIRLLSYPWVVTKPIKGMRNRKKLGSQLTGTCLQLGKVAKQWHKDGQSWVWLSKNKQSWVQSLAQPQRFSIPSYVSQTPGRK